MSKKNIYVAGYPKSGTVYLTRLLGSVLDSPTAAYWDKQNKSDIAAEGRNRPGPYIIRRGHFVLMNQVTAKTVPDHHMLAWRVAMHDATILIMRDPRDVATSAKHYYKGGTYTIEEILRFMQDGTGPFRLMGSWVYYMRTWLRTSNKFPCALVKYENLVKNPVRSIKALGELLDLELPSDRKIKHACDKESFVSRRKRIQRQGHKMNLGATLNLKHMRKGKPGDWVNHFSPSDKKFAASFLNPLMLELGYVQKVDWWKG